MENTDARPWWKDAIIYQIYPRSFQDSNGDGMGDIPGIISRLDAVKALGVNALWLSPIYISPQKDNGYDIADYCGIDPRFGTLEDFDHLVAEATDRGIRIIMDLVINHTSDQHPWFQASRRRQAPYGTPAHADSETADETDYYIWRSAKPDGSLPNNWTGFFQGPVWEWDDERQQYYLHLFDKGQPDLNWHNPAVLEEIKKVLTFWMDRGVAGFRCDVISLLWKSSLADSDGREIIRGLEYYKAQPGTHEILRTLRKDVLEPRGAFTVGETVMVTLDEARDLAEPERKELDTLFYFDHLEVDRLVARFVPKPFSAEEFLKRLTTWQQGLSWNSVYLENHDQPRIVSHYGDDGMFWARSAKLLATLELTLRGTAFIYQGQELGMTNFDFTSLDQLDDIESRNMDAMLRRWHVPQRLRWWIISTASRDNARTPYQWDRSQAAGFTTGTPWLGINANKDWINYADEDEDPASVLWWYRKLIAYRKQSDTLREGEFEPIMADRHIMVYRRLPVPGSTDGVHTIFLNFSDKTSKLEGEWYGQVVISNTGRRSFAGYLKPWEAIVVREG